MTLFPAFILDHAENSVEEETTAYATAVKSALPPASIDFIGLSRRPTGPLPHLHASP